MPARGERGSPARRCASRSAITGSRPWCHGFRSSFRDWAAEETDHHREVIEAALAHGVRNQAEAAYARSDGVRAPPPPDGRLGRLWTRLHSRGIRSLLRRS